MAYNEHESHGGESRGHAAGGSHSDGYHGHGGYRGGASGGRRDGFHKGGSGNGSRGGYRGNRDERHGGKEYGDRGGYRRDDRGGRDGFKGNGGYRGRRDDHRDFRRDDGERGGYRGNNGGRRDFHRDGERSGSYRDGGNRRDFRREDSNRGGYRGSDRRDFHRDDRRDGGREGYRGNGRRDFHRDDRRDGFREDRRDFRRDDERNDYRGNNGGRRDGERRDFRQDGGRSSFGREGGRGGYRGNDRKDFRRDDRRSDDRRGNFGGREDRRDFRRDGGDHGGYRGNDRRQGGDRRDFRRDNGHREDRRDFRRDSRDDRQQHRDHDRRSFNDGRSEYMDRGMRRNSDGTISFPSQNPYTDRRPDEPRMPRGMEWSMLSKDEKERLRGLSKEHAENTGLHILAAYALEESDPAAALEHAKWVARQASRIDFARETLAFVAYRQGDYKLALREFQTAQRMNGYGDYMPFMADCERGLGNPKKAVALALSDEAKSLTGEAKAEMFLVYAGALSDLGLLDQAISVVDKLGKSNIPGAYRMRALQAEQYFLEQAGRSDEATDLDVMLDKLEQRYADVDEEDEEPVIDYDLERLPDDMMEELGITEEDAQYAPEPERRGGYDDERDEFDASSEQNDGADTEGNDTESDDTEESLEEDDSDSESSIDEGAVEAAGTESSQAAIIPETAEAQVEAQASVAQEADGFDVIDPRIHTETVPQPPVQDEAELDADEDDETQLSESLTQEGVDSDIDPAQQAAVSSEYDENGRGEQAPQSAVPSDADDQQGEE